MDTPLPPPSVLDKRHKLFFKNKAGCAALKHHPPAQGLLISGEATPQRQNSSCLLWRKPVPGDDGDGTSLNVSHTSCEAEDTLALLTALRVSEAVKQNKRKRHFAKAVVAENKVPQETGEVFFRPSITAAACPWGTWQGLTFHQRLT